MAGLNKGKNTFSFNFSTKQLKVSLLHYILALGIKVNSELHMHKSLDVNNI